MSNKGNKWCPGFVLMEARYSVMNDLSWQCLCCNTFFGIGVFYFCWRRECRWSEGFYTRLVRTGPWKPGKSCNFKIWIPGQKRPGIFVGDLERPGIWTYRSIFLTISVQEFSRYTSSEIWVYVCALKVREFIEKVLEFDIGNSWNLRCQNVYEPCYSIMELYIIMC